MGSPSTNFTNNEIADQRRPAELYKFWTDDEVTEWFFTSHDDYVTYDGDLYVPSLIGRGENEKDIQLEVSKMTINVDQVNEIFKKDLTQKQAQKIWVAVYKLHKSDLTVAAHIFLGMVKATSFDGLNCSIECVGFEHFLRQPVPKLRYQPTCNNSLFDDRCGLLASTYAVQCTVTDISSDRSQLTCAGLSSAASDAGKSAYSEDYFNWGYIDVSKHRRMVVSHSGDVVTVRIPVDDASLVTGVVATIYPGCDRLYATCKNKWLNEDHFFGFPNMPLDNPVTWQ